MQRGEPHRIVGFDRIAILDLGPLDPGKRRFQADDVPGVGGSVDVTGQAEHAFNVPRIGGSRLPKFGLLAEVVIAIRQAEAVLAEVEHISGRVVRILMNARGVGCADSDDVQMSDERRNFGLADERADSCEFRLQGFRAEGLRHSLVHEACV